MIRIPLILSLFVLFSPLALAAQQPISDGALTYEQLSGSRSIPFYPPLPPNSEDLVYDDGNYTGSSRNLQNPGIHQGWPYWAHQVRFTPVASMTGSLLELRYVAAIQWGSATDMEVFIRDAAGVQLASLSGITAVMDSNNWQILDVSSLGFVPGSADFYVEIRPAASCTGTNGFTIPYSMTGSGRSAFSDDCTNPFSSYAFEPRDQFIRAVIATDSSPTISVSNLVAGQQTLVEVTNATPNNFSHFAWSIHGGGPTSTPWGDAMVTPPYSLKLLPTDSTGYASYTVNVPLHAAGVTVWCHGTDVGTQSMLNALMLLIQ